MYVTRPLSHYKRFPDDLSLPPQGPNSGYLVIQDEESETNYSCFGLCKDPYLPDLPFPQNKLLTTRYSSGAGEQQHVSYNDVIFIPVLNQPLSSNRYYAIQPHGSHKGEAFTCSKEEDMRTCCFCRCVKDVKPRPLNPHDTYQELEIFPYEGACVSGGSFYAKSIAPDGFPPYIFRRKGWQIRTKTPKNYKLHEAQGIDPSLRSRLPDINLLPSSIIVGKWYCPFMFVKEGPLRDQVKLSVFYEMTLERRWEQIFANGNEGNGYEPQVETDVQVEVAFIGGGGDARELALWDERDVVDGFIWFTSSGYDNKGLEQTSTRVGLSQEIVQRMKWEEERAGWISGEGRIARVNKRPEFEGTGTAVWKRFGCYILVERFSLRRMDGSLVLAYDFKHTHQIKFVFE